MSGTVAKGNLSSAADHRTATLNVREQAGSAAECTPAASPAETPLAANRQEQRGAHSPVRPWRQRLARTLLSLAGSPPLVLRLWDGTEVRATRGEPVATVSFHDAATLRRVCLSPFYQFGEAYADGRLDVQGDLAELLRSVNRAIDRSRLAGWLYRLSTRGLHLPRWNTLRASRKNVYHHYDLGNDFYRLWLDEQLAYTCAYYPSEGMSLEEAQTAKFDHVCRKLQLQPGQRVVEAGCGWGGLALHMARNYGVSVVAYNVSREQVAYARQQARDQGLDSQVEFIEDDWRRIEGRYDVFVSVGMLEHVGLHNYRQLGEVIHRVLPDDGRGLLHSIGRNKPAPTDRWIEHHIFPGSYPPSLVEMLGVLEPREFSVLDVENLRLHYAQTLRHWLDRFEQSAEQVAAMFDDRFVRMWRLYLAGSMAGFETGGLQLFQVLFTRGRSNRVPRTRAHLYGETEAAWPGAAPSN